MVLPAEGEESFSLEPNQSTVFEPQLPPWLSANRLVKKEFKQGTLSLATVKLIIAQAFNAIAATFPNYQTRSAQIGMAEQILQSLLQGREVVVEAGTGVGKSFAYLVAALAWSYLRGERVLVVTETKNLQVQLIEKDIPFLANVLDPLLTFELALGASNYLCRLRYENALMVGTYRDFISDEEMKKWHSWVAQVFSNERLHGHIYEAGNDFPQELWLQINRDPEGCPASKCPHYQNCNYYRARKAWEKARLLVGNHYLLLLHLLNEKRTLPPVGVIIIDEAHGFLKNGFATFTLSYSANALADQRKIAEGMEKKANLPPEKKEELTNLWRSAENAWQRFFQSIEIEQNLSFVENKLVVVSQTQVPTNNLPELLAELVSNYRDMSERVEDPLLLNDLRSLTKQMERFESFIRRFTDFNTDTDIYWAEKQANLLYLNTCRLNVAEEINFLMPEQCVYTSATLGYWAGGDLPQDKAMLIKRGYFSSFCREVLSAREMDRVDFNVFFSPFAYDKQVLLYIPLQLVAPEFNALPEQQKKYEEQLFSEIAKLVLLAKGGALVLFTSHYLMRQACEALRQMTELRIISQAELGAVAALDEFRKDKHAVLLGVTSFWQGVDIAGPNLRLLIITKLMFQIPEDPIFKARSEKLALKGHNPFYELALPFASAMLRQGFGRLIRREDDRGVVAILDSRILQKNYGKILISNLPRCKLFSDFTALEKEVSARKFFSF